MRGSIGEELSERARTNNVIQHTFWWLVTNAPPSSTGNAHSWISGIHSNTYDLKGIFLSLIRKIALSKVG